MLRGEGKEHGTNGVCGWPGRIIWVAHTWLSHTDIQLQQKVDEGAQKKKRGHTDNAQIPHRRTYARARMHARKQAKHGGGGKKGRVGFGCPDIAPFQMPCFVPIPSTDATGPITYCFLPPGSRLTTEPCWIRLSLMMRG